MKQVGRTLRIWYVGGGTGGHIFPLFAVERQVRALCSARTISCTSLLITGVTERERSWASEYPITSYHIHGGKLRRYVSLRNITDLALIAAGMFESLLLFIFRRPDVIFSKGGYISVPPLILARLFAVRTVLHESDLTLGLANRICAPLADTLCLNNPYTIGTLSPSVQKKAVVTGLASRLEGEQQKPVDVFRRFSLDPAKPLVTVIGGSLGARRINELIPDLFEAMEGSVQIVHQSGKGQKGMCFPEDEGSLPSGYVRLPFLTEEYAGLLKASVCVISRAGASAIADYLAFQVPMLLIPLPLSASRGDQIKNADLYEKAGCALVFDNDTVSASTLAQAVGTLIENPAELQKMRESMKGLYRPNASNAIAQILVDGTGRSMVP
ncbi:MAG: UDP-N-acetylglucosamine--N-acetylmuramyl-(pentapeptide) pyrophosphoryl-undecaprenol N-acetylglucosamine transferase [Sphaerochaetaceae bacterium]|nr:UDP-N-acetylglucosamine--N-acetylmuramyl-(pentapeptide) pyrophosphoryl-undecaprenol N-acetylglucosamine transferase [Sphaerochaetaceae bacterium]